MPYVNHISTVCMSDVCPFYNIPRFRSFDPTIDLYGNRVRCNKCGQFTGIIVNVAQPYYYDFYLLRLSPQDDAPLDENGDESGYNLLPTDPAPSYPLKQIPPFEMYPATIKRPAMPNPLPPKAPSASDFPPPHAQNFPEMFARFKKNPNPTELKLDLLRRK